MRLKFGALIIFNPCSSAISISVKRRLLSWIAAVATCLSAVIAIPALADPPVNDQSVYQDCMAMVNAHGSNGRDEAIVQRCQPGDRYFSARLREETGEGREEMRFYGAVCGMETGVAQIRLGDVYRGRAQVKRSELGFKYVAKNSTDHDLIAAAKDLIAVIELMP